MAGDEVVVNRAELLIGLPIGVALTGAPGLAGLLLARRAYPESVVGAAARRLRRLRPAWRRGTRQELEGVAP